MLPSSSRTVISTPQIAGQAFFSGQTQQAASNGADDCGNDTATAAADGAAAPPMTAPAAPPIGVLVPSIFTGRRDSMVPMRTVCTTRFVTGVRVASQTLQAQPPSSSDRVVKQATSRGLTHSINSKGQVFIRRCSLTCHGKPGRKLLSFKA